MTKAFLNCLNCGKQFEREHELFQGSSHLDYFCCEKCCMIDQLKKISKVLDCEINNGFACSTCLMSWCMHIANSSTQARLLYESFEKIKDIEKTKGEREEWKMRK